MKKVLFILSILLVSIPCIAFAESTTKASVGFYIAEEDKGVQYIDGGSDTPYIKNFELNKIKIIETTNGVVTEHYFDESDGMEIPFEFYENSNYTTTVIYAP